MDLIDGKSRAWPGYGAVWRWHFYAGLFCIPFVLWLAATGSIYIFRQEIETILDRPYAHVAQSEARLQPSALAERTVAAVPGATLHTYQLPETADEAVQIVVGAGKRKTRVYLNPETGAVLNTVDDDGRLMRLIFRLHGELMSGNAGSYLVELAASWTIVMLVSGLFLWWPRAGGWAGVLYPRLRAGGRRFWRDLHAVTGFWVSLFALALLLSGLPWAKSWGAYLRLIRSVAERTVGPQDWSAGEDAEMRERVVLDRNIRAAMDEHAEHRGMSGGTEQTAYEPLDRVVAAAGDLRFAPPVLIGPPQKRGGAWSVKSDAANRPKRAEATIDGATGQTLTRIEFGQRPVMDRMVGYGVAAHEGRLFGIANQLLNLGTALGLIVMVTSSLALWLRRRPGNALGAPPVPAAPPAAAGFVALLVALGVFLPLFGASMLAVLAVEALVLRRWPRAREWLGLSTLGRTTG